MLNETMLAVFSDVSKRDAAVAEVAGTKVLVQYVGMLSPVTLSGAASPEIRPFCMFKGTRADGLKFAAHGASLEFP